MKSFKLSIAIMMLVMLVSLIGSNSSNAEGEYVGDHCWEWVKKNGDSGILKFSFFRIADQHYLWSGVCQCPEGVVPAFGNAEVINGEMQLIYTQTGIDANGSVWSRIASCTLDIPTFDGRCEARKLSEMMGKTVVTYCSSTLTAIPCPE
jgi:hypothetical protein